METHKLEVTEKQLEIIRDALEVYSRCKMGQFQIAMQTMFPNLWLNYSVAEDIEKYIRKTCNEAAQKRLNSVPFPLEDNASWGIGHENVGDGTEAYVIMQVIRQFLSVKRNDGWFTYRTDSDDPLEYVSGDHIPKIEGFDKSKCFYIENEQKAAEAVKLYKRKKFPELWALIDETIKPREKYSGSLLKIEYDKKRKECFLRILKPVKKNEPLF